MPAHGRRELGAFLQQRKPGDELDRIACLEDDRVAVRVGIVLTGRAGDREAAGRHHLEADQAERLVPGVGEHRIARGVDERNHRIAQEGREVDHVHVWVLAKERREAQRVGWSGGVDQRQALAPRVVDHLAPVRLATAAHHQLHALPVALEICHRGYGHQPPLVRVETADLEADVIRIGRGSDGDHRGGIRVGDRRARDAVGDDDRVVAGAPHRVLHVAAHRRDRRSQLERRPIDPVEAERVVRVPEHHDAVPQAAAVQGVGDQAHGPRRVPFLAEHNHAAAAFDSRHDHIVDDARRQAGIPVAELALLAVVDAAPMLRGNPLAPASVMQLAPLVGLFSGQVGVTDKVEVRVEAKSREGTRQTLHSNTEAARLAVRIGSFEAEQHEDGLVGREDHSFEPRIFSACA